MAHLIDKDALVAEIERRIKRFREEKDSVSIVKTNTYKGIFSFIDTLEVKDFQEEPVSEDLELTWKDIRDIYDLAYKLRFSHKKQKEFFEEVLKRFREMKERKDKMK